MAFVHRGWIVQGPVLPWHEELLHARPWLGCSGLNARSWGVLVGAVETLCLFSCCCLISSKLAVVKKHFKTLLERGVRLRWLAIEGSAGTAAKCEAVALSVPGV